MKRCYEEIGLFEDTSYIIQLLKQTCNRRERDRLVIFISKLMLHKDNVKKVIDANGIKGGEQAEKIHQKKYFV